MANWLIKTNKNQQKLTDSFALADYQLYLAEVSPSSINQVSPLS